MENGTLGEKLKENHASSDNEDTASEAPVWIKAGKSSVTLKDRALLNIRLAKQGTEKITQPTQWRYEENGDDR